MTGTGRTKVGGFTLIELMIVVVVIAILAAFAVPSWRRYVYRSHRVDGQNLLMQVAQAEERYYTNYNRYPLSATSLGFTTDPAISEHGYYSVALSLPAASSAGQGYLATATPIGAQVGDACGPLSIDNTGLKQPLPTDTAHNSNGSCW